MKRGKIASFAFAASATFMLSGCVPNAGVTRPVTVKAIMQDVDGYAAREFSTASLPNQVERAAVNADSHSVGFHRLVLQTITSGTQNGSAGISSYTDQTVYDNLGNGLVRSVSTMSSNGISISDSLSISYRNLYTLRGQNIVLSSTNAPRILQTETVSHSDTPFDGHDMHFSFDYGYVGQVRNFVHGDINCKFGHVFSASEINKKMSGTARDLDCQTSNRNDVVFSKSHGAYLDQYGIFVVLKRETSTSNITFKVTDFHVE